MRTNTLTPSQGFHWFATYPVLQTLHSALQPHGTLGLIWNAETYNSPRSHTPPTTWEAALQAHTLSFEDSQGRFRNEIWRKVFEEQVSKSPLNLIVASDSPLFSMPLGENREEWTVWLGREAVWDRYRTLGQVAMLEGEELAVSLAFLLLLLSGFRLGFICHHGFLIFSALPRVVWSFSASCYAFRQMIDADGSPRRKPEKSSTTP